MKKSAETKRLLIETVKTILKSTHDIRVKDITDNAFVNIAAVNYHFDDKDCLVEIAMNEIFADFKYCLIGFDIADFDNRDSAVCGFLDTLFSFVSSNVGFFKRLSIQGDRMYQFFSEEELNGIATRQLIALSVSNNKTSSTAFFANVLSQVIFAVLLFPSEVQQKDSSEFFRQYYNQIKNQF